MSGITDSDYKKILEFYEKPIPHSKRLLKMEAEKIAIAVSYSKRVSLTQGNKLLVI